MGHKTPLYQAHLAAGAKIVDFGGWDMPIHYGSQLDEHHAVHRRHGVEVDVGPPERLNLARAHPRGHREHEDESPFEAPRGLAKRLRLCGAKGHRFGPVLSGGLDALHGALG